MSTEGVISHELTLGNGVDFVLGEIILNMQHFSGNQSILVMDNFLVLHTTQTTNQLKSC